MFDTRNFFFSNLTFVKYERGYTKVGSSDIRKYLTCSKMYDIDKRSSLLFTSVKYTKAFIKSGQATKTSQGEMKSE